MEMKEKEIEDLIPLFLLLVELQVRDSSNQMVSIVTET